MDVITGDEWMVQCWGGDGWVDAWMVVDVYSSFNGSRAVLLNDGFGGTDDGWKPQRGTIVVPEATPAGFYRLHEQLGVDGEGLVAVEAQFEVSK